MVDFVRRWVPSRFRPISLSDVEAAVTAISARYHGARLVFDLHEAVLMAERLPHIEADCRARIAESGHLNRSAD